MPANAADQHHRGDGEEQVRREGDQHQRETRRDDARAEQPVVRDAPRHLRRGPHPEGQPDEDRGEEDAVGGVAAAEALRVERGRPDDDAARREGADDADDQAADERCAGDERRAVADQGEHARGGGAAAPDRPEISGMPRSTVSAMTR